MGKAVRSVALAALVVVTAGAGIGLAFAAGQVFLAQTLAVIQALAIGKAANDLLSPELPSFGSSRQLKQNLSLRSDSTATRQVAFGRVGVAGQVIFRDNIENAGDTPNEVLIVVALAGYPCDALERFWLNGELVFDGDSTTGPGAITTGPFADDLWVWFRTGEETTPAFGDIASRSAAWGNRTRTLRGICCIGLRVRVTEQLDGRLEPFAELRGARLYDPRLDSTVPGGSGAHRINDQTTWAWSRNPKLAELAYLIGPTVAGVRIFGMGKSAAAIDLESFAAEANVCDEQVAVAGGGTIARYTCDGILNPSSDHRQNLRQLLTASAGTMDASEGIYRTFSGAWRAPSMTLTESDIDGAPTNIQLQQDPRKEINVVQGVFANANSRYKVMEYPERRDSASVLSFGENVYTLDLPFTTDHRTAQRIVKIQMFRLNAPRRFAGRYALRTLPLQSGDIVTQTYARYRITAETFRVMFWALEADQDRDGANRLLCTLQLTSEQQSWFNWDEATEEQPLLFPDALPSVPSLPKITVLPGEITFEGSIAPTNPRVGWLWLDTDVDIVYRWDGANWIEYARIGADGITAVPPFDPGRIGGQSNLVFTINQLANGTPNDGEIRMVGTTFEHPDGTSITPAAQFVSIGTPYEGAITGRFYVMYSAVSFEARFGGVVADWGNEDTRFGCVTWDSVNGWRARDNSSVYYAFTPLATDCIIAVGEKTSASGGMDSLVSLLAGLAGDDAVVANPIDDESASGSMAIGAQSWPRVPDLGLNLAANYTPTDAANNVQVNWRGQANVSVNFGGTGSVSGATRLSLQVQVNSVVVFQTDIEIDFYRDADSNWAVLNGSKTFNVPAGQQIQVSMRVFQDGSGTGIAFEQTIYWRECEVELIPFNRAA